MASPVTQPATLHAIRQDNMAVHILRLSLFSRLVNNFLYASHFCHENAMGGKKWVQSSLGFLARKSNEQSARLYSQCKKTLYTKYFWGKDRETRKAEKTSRIDLNSYKTFKNGNNKKKTPLLREMLPVYCKLTLQESDLGLKKNNSCHHFSSFVVYCSRSSCCLAA